MDRTSRADAADALCVSAYDVAGAPSSGCALVAVGGYGRRELAPYSDLDVVLVHEDDLDIGDVAEKVWYPIWDSGARLDHAVRTVSEMIEQARADLRVALGLLDVRHVAGDAELTFRLRSEVLAWWRRSARERLPALREMVSKRHRIVGELAHLSVPDLKEAEGGLRDATVLTGLVATWLVDVPHVDLERSRRSLLDVRDALHDAAGRSTDRIGPELWAPLAERLGVDDEAAAQRHVRELGRRITHLSRLTWRRVDGILTTSVPRHGVRRPELVSVEPGVALSRSEVVLTRDARPGQDPTLLLRSAAVAAERDVELAPATATRLAAECPELPDPWPPTARQAMVRLLAAGRGLLPVWETLEETGALESFLPEWEQVRLLPHATEVHRYTVDRHLVQTCVEAAGLIRQVARPDVLMVAALLHDIGKGGLTEHSIAGEPIARAIAERMGYHERAAALVARLVRHHLLLARTATTRDPEDPATAQGLAEVLGDVETLDLLLALTEADARATSPQAWSSWRAGLVRTVAARTAALLGEPTATATGQGQVAIPRSVRRGGTAVGVAQADEGVRVTVLAPDRIGLLADVAAVFALQRATVRSARAWSQDDVGVSVWDVAEDHLDERVLRQHLEAIAAGRLDPGARSRPGRSTIAPTVAVRPEAS
ncbi:MAG TPA: [protein-PII] uridylyltransferase, partial [Nocardioides sp.]|nr:[protein-PII] uridylyltransferase [Nocardioides sp.]